MHLVAECPRCPSPAIEGTGADAGSYLCAVHGPTPPLWRPSTATYDAFAEHLERSRAMPTWMPWPLPIGWSVSDFGCVARPGRNARATFAASTGLTELDGLVEIDVVAEEPGTGLGARCADVTETDPGSALGGTPALRVEVDGHTVPLWALSTAECDTAFNRSVFVGEAQGRWLWLVLRPASAALMFAEEQMLTDVTDLGPALVDLSFRDVPRAW